MNFDDRNTFVNMKFLYSALPDPDFYVYVLIDDFHADLEGKVQRYYDFYAWCPWASILSSIFNAEPHIFAMHYIFKKWKHEILYHDLKLILTNQGMNGIFRIYPIFDLNVFKGIAFCINKLCGTKKRRKMIKKRMPDNCKIGYGNISHKKMWMKLLKS